MMSDAAADAFSMVSTSSRYPTLARQLKMAVARINRTLAALDLSRASQVPRESVCDATLAEWSAFQQTDGQALRSSYMEWIEGKIYIVELPSVEHDYYAHEFHNLIVIQPAVLNYLRGHSTSSQPNRPQNETKYEADASYGPEPQTRSRLPHGVPSFADWRTLVLEVGYARRWGTSPGYLDWKAQMWAGVPGVRFILCVAVTNGLASAEFKLYTVHLQDERLQDLVPQPIVHPTLVSFNSRELLGLQPGDPLPRDPPTPLGVPFPDPLVVDLHAVLVRARNVLIPLGAQV
ncbi:hypothetical protein PHYPSEUDO_002498 [Phytophthora pseudosyringae]|uniref:Uncharacterized protein n=1 Tax=Phytophthora pseudosyringae TaxID=221518 RepID=A0A8T1V6L8_9STRA|nr:hypothetical protein PHYPSEUDO_002498 [Phytophthora pseudosyringae]